MEKTDVMSDFKQFFDEISSLEGIQVTQMRDGEDEDAEILHIKIINKQKWNEALSTLVPYFGKMIFEEYERKSVAELTDSSALNQIIISFKNVDDVYVLRKNNQIVGFTSTEDILNDEKRVVLTRDIMVKKEERGNGYGNKLARMFFHENPYASLGYSKTPTAMSARRKMAEQCGYFFSWGGIVKDECMKEVESLRIILKKYLENEGILSRREAPEGFVFLTSTSEGTTVLPPLSEDEVNFSKNDPLRPQFELLLRHQEKIEKFGSGESLVGLSVCVRKTRETISACLEEQG
ncbi:GNAT family N-acetyltransferase [Candidatus Peregrinibacteria bacterium]|nr:GNAT family N-acetyltransferase [Candidatus Peregrinibacteria bacterium]